MRVAFWTAFGIYMRQHVSALGTRQKWVNYNTGVKGIYFRLEAEARFARVSITMEHQDAGIRALFFDQWAELKNYLESESAQVWRWESEYTQEDGRTVARIYVEQSLLSLFSKTDWPAIFEFMSGALVPLDNVWADCQGVFQDLAE